MTPVMSQPAVPVGIMEGRGATATYLWEAGWVPFTVLWNSTGQPAVLRPGRVLAHRPAAGRAVGGAAQRGGNPPLPRRSTRARATLGGPPPARGIGPGRRTTARRPWRVVVLFSVGRVAPLGGCELALGGLEDAGAVLVGALVGADLLGAVVVALGEDGLDLGDGQLVVAGPRLVAAQRADAAQDRGAVLFLRS